MEINLARPNVFIIQFSNAEARDHVLEGPWHIQNKPLIVRKWESGMTSLDFKFARFPIWLHLRHVPLELFTRFGLSYIASAIGVLLTSSYQRLAYAKIDTENIPKKAKVACAGVAELMKNIKAKTRSPNDKGKVKQGKAMLGLGCTYLMNFLIWNVKGLITLSSKE
ncbi:hypothetical protein DITRI_Ditri20bG0106000 [Diplodiscus trichospermus]